MIISFYYSFGANCQPLIPFDSLWFPVNYNAGCKVSKGFHFAWNGRLDFSLINTKKVFPSFCWFSSLFLCHNNEYFCIFLHMAVICNYFSFNFPCYVTVNIFVFRSYLQNYLLLVLKCTICKHYTLSYVVWLIQF